MVFNTTFNNISVILWQSVLLVVETGVPGENHQPVVLTDRLYDIMLNQAYLAMNGVRYHILIGTDYTGGSKPIYHSITTMTALFFLFEQQLMIIMSIQL